MKNIIQTPKAPAAIGPYSQGIIAQNLVFLSGQIPLTADGSSKTDQDITIQTRQVMDNIAALLAHAGCSFDSVVKTTIFLTNMADFDAVNGIYAQYFTAAPPARSTIAVAALPKGARIEIECIALSPEGG